MDMKTDEQIIQEVYLEKAGLMEFSHDKTIWKQIALEAMKRAKKQTIELITSVTPEVSKDAANDYDNDGKICSKIDFMIGVEWVKNYLLRKIK